jgi:hypothetical protein
MRVPSVYLYEIRDGKHCLYLGDYSTSEGLGLLSPNSQVRMQHLWGKKVFVLPDQLASPQSLASIARFVDATESIVDFECLIDSEVVFSTHDDSECHFEFLDRQGCEGVLRRSVGANLAEVLWNALLAHCGRYVTIRDDRTIIVYETFYDYLASLR